MGKPKSEKPKARSRSRAASGAPTVREVARLAGVSAATVSRALNASSTVSPELAERVLNAARQLNFRPNRLARNLRMGAVRTVGLLVPDIENPFFTSAVHGVEEALQAAGYTLLLANFGEDPAREEALLRTLSAEGVAGIIFTASIRPSVEYTRLLSGRLPMVGMSRVLEGLPVDLVLTDNRGGALEATEHLIRLGHRRIALINGPATISTARERQAGFEEAFARAHLPVPKELIRHADFRQAGGFEAMQDLLRQSPRPTAVFVASNLMTLGALEALHRAEVRIPEEMAIVGFDDMAWATSLRPPLTVVAQPAREMGAAAAKLLIERLQNPDLPPRRITLPTRLIVRSSCGSGACAAVARNS